MPRSSSERKCFSADVSDCDFKQSEIGRTNSGSRSCLASANGNVLSSTTFRFCGISAAKIEIVVELSQRTIAEIEEDMIGWFNFENTKLSHFRRRALLSSTNLAYTIQFEETWRLPGNHCEPHDDNCLVCEAIDELRMILKFGDFRPRRSNTGCRVPRLSCFSSA